MSPAARLLRDPEQHREQIGVVERDRGRPDGHAAHREGCRVVVAADGSFTRRHDLGAALREPDRVDAGNRGQRDGDVALEDRRASAHDVQAQADRARGGNLHVQQVAATVGIQIGEIRARRRARQEELGRRELNAGVHRVGVELLPERVHRAEPPEAPLAAPERHRPGQRLPEVVVHVHETRDQELAAPVQFDFGRRGGTGLRAKRRDAWAVDAQPSVDDRLLVPRRARVDHRGMADQHGRPAAQRGRIHRESRARLSGGRAAPARRAAGCFGRPASAACRASSRRS